MEDDTTPPPPPTVIYTIGHSSHSTETLLALLTLHAIRWLVDVRSQPYSRYNPQFNREPLSKSLQVEQIGYRHMGDTLGGRPDQADLYDDGNTRPNYSRQRQTERYRQGLQQLLRLADDATVAIMCSEGNPHECHRQWLITPDLIDRGVEVLHIHPDGKIETAEKTLEQLGFGF